MRALLWHSVTVPACLDSETAALGAQAIISNHVDDGMLAREMSLRSHTFLISDKQALYGQIVYLHCRHRCIQ